jgi:hypothetical protein
MYTTPLYLQSKNDRYKALLAMAVGIEQMQNVDTMARKVRVHPKFFHSTSNYIFLVKEGLSVLF